MVLATTQIEENVEDVVAVHVDAKFEPLGPVLGFDVGLLVGLLHGLQNGLLVGDLEHAEVNEQEEIDGAKRTQHVDYGL